MKQKRDKVWMAPHIECDWCHLCGENRYDCVDITYPVNAVASSHKTEYLRICQKCAYDIAWTANQPVAKNNKPKIGQEW